MVTETTATEAPTEFGATVETPEAPATEAAPSPPVEPEEAPEAPSTPVTLDDYLGKDEGLKSAYDARLSEFEAETRKKVEGELHPKYDKARQANAEARNVAAAAVQGVQAIREALDELKTEGFADDKAIARALNAAPHAMAAFNGLAAQAAWFDSMRWAAQQEATKLGEAGAKFTQEYVTRWNNAQTGLDDAETVYSEMMKARDDALIEKAKKPLENRIRTLEAQIAKKGVEDNAGSGPGKTPTRSGGTISTIEEADRRYNLPTGHAEKIDHEAYKAARERFGIK